MKKILSLVLCALLVCSCLSSCASTSVQSDLLEEDMSNAAVKKEDSTDKNAASALVGCWMRESETEEISINGVLTETKTEDRPVFFMQFFSDGTMIEMGISKSNGRPWYSNDSISSWKSYGDIVIVGDSVYQYSIDGDRLVLRNARYELDGEFTYDTTYDAVAHWDGFDTNEMVETKNATVFTRKNMDIIDCFGEFYHNYTPREIKYQ